MQSPQILSKLGEGGTGCVYKVKLSTGEIGALKSIKLPGPVASLMAPMVEEIQGILDSIGCEHMVQPIKPPWIEKGSSDNTDLLHIPMELCEFGTLKSFIEGKKAGNLICLYSSQTQGWCPSMKSVVALYRCLVGGLRWLHSRGRKILLDQSETFKVYITI